jgi:hypothetical protein
MAAFTASGCGILDPGELEKARDRLEEAERLWERNGPTSYSFVIERLCFCPTEITSPVRVTVANRAVASRTYVATGLPVPTQWAPLFPAVEGVFAIVSEAIDRKAHELDVEYDASRGYPKSANIDYVEQAVDEELIIRLRELTP